MLKWTIALVMALVVLDVLAQVVKADPPSDQLIQALITVESHGDDSEIGDIHLLHHAYGCLQVRQPCVDDYNRWNRTLFEAKDCLNNRALSIKIAYWYIDHYATKSRLGHVPTDEDKARIWNGGPGGWHKSATRKYWARVKSVLDTAH